MAVIKPKGNGNASATLQALTAAALVLPGLMQTPAKAAEGDEFRFQYGRYEESGGTKSRFRTQKNDIVVDSLLASGQMHLFDRWKMRVTFSQDTWSGASPLTTAPAAVVKFNRAVDVHTGASSFWDVRRGIVAFDTRTLRGVNGVGRNAITTGETVHVMAQASPETRKQGDFKLGYEWDQASIDIGGGLSVENDYTSRYLNLGGHWDFNQKLTTLSWGLSYTNSTIDAQRFRFRASSVPVAAAAGINPNFPDWSTQVNADRRDQAARLGLTQVLDKNSVVELGFNYIHNSGYLSNPYKESIFLAPLDARDFGAGRSYLFSRYDNRPNQRDQFTWNVLYNRYFSLLDASLHLGYNFFHDSWGINAHTFDASWGQPVVYGFTITPHVRYYSQSAADFYSPYFVLDQSPLRASQVFLTDPQFGLIDNTANLKTPDRFSSDQRLSGFGALSGGVTVSKQFAKGVNFQAGFEYYTHASKLKLGGGGSGKFADFNYYVANAAISVNFDALGSIIHDYGASADVDDAANSAAAGQHSHHQYHHDHNAHNNPAGVMYAHTLSKAGDAMVGYRYMFSSQDGATLHGTERVLDRAIVNNGCGTRICRLTASYMNMHMHMLDLMYAPTDWLTLMLMPQFMDMDMNLRPLSGVPPISALAEGGHNHSAGGGGHQTGGVGDTIMSALVKLFDMPGHHLHLSLAFSAPTGDVGIKLRGVDLNAKDPSQGLLIHYGMQLGSGTWDFRPSLTYNGEHERWFWGAQLNGVTRMERRNASGYALGDNIQATAWGGYRLFDWLSTSVRGIYTAQSAISGAYKRPTTNSAPVDFPFNYGGSYWDVGFGLSAMVTGGMFKGNRFSIEWVQPVEDNVIGYQLGRVGSLYATWGLMF